MPKMQYEKFIVTLFSNKDMQLELRTNMMLWKMSGIWKGTLKGNTGDNSMSCHSEERKTKTKGVDDRGNSQSIEKEIVDNVKKWCRIYIKHKYQK